MGTTEELPTVISFCSGYGGIERGLDLAGVKHRVLAYVEIEAYVIANLLAKMESGELAPAPVWTNLKTFPAHLFRGAVDIITGGYPCQPFSAAGSRKGADDPRHIWPYIREHIKTIRPERTFFENVEGHISLGLSTVISDLEEDGYRTAWGLFSAREVGAPHRRKRVFIMAHTNGNEQRSGLGQGESERNTTGECSSNGSRMEEFRVVGNAQHDELSNTQSKRLQRLAVSGASISEGQKSDDQQFTRCSKLHGQVFPARPNEEQYDWEHSRIEPKLGGKSNGYSNRVDRLRLLGNGVVPQTAAKAWEVLDAKSKI